MIGIVLAAHGPLPRAFLESSGMILGDLPQITSLSLMPGDSLEGLVDRLSDAVKEVETGDGVLIFLDMFGGTPANATALLSQQIAHVRAITGMNLPMLLETLTARMNTNSLEELAEQALSQGRASIIDVVEAFKKFRQDKVV